VIKEIQPPPFDQIWAGKSHHLSDSLLVSPTVALGFALLAHGLRVMGTPETFSDPIGEKLRAGLTQLSPVVNEGSCLFEGDGERVLIMFPMFLLTEDTDESDENLDILFLLLAQVQTSILPLKNF